MLNLSSPLQVVNLFLFNERILSVSLNYIVDVAISFSSNINLYSYLLRIWGKFVILFVDKSIFYKYLSSFSSSAMNSKFSI